MTQRLITLMAALLLLGFVVAGCGDEDSDGTAATDTVTDVVTDIETDVETETDTVTDDETVTEETDTTEGGGAAAPQSVEQAVAYCKTIVTAYPQLLPDTKSDLESLCEKSGAGDGEGAQKIGREVCGKIITELYPVGVPGKAQALRACKNSF